MIASMPTKSDKSIPKTLFASILIMLMPFIICIDLFHMNGVMKPLIAGAYVIEIFLMVTTFIDGNTKVHGLFIIAYGLILLQFTTLCIDSILGIKINLNDYINAFAKALNFLLLFGVMSNVKVSKSQIKSFMLYMTVFAVIACIYNFVVNRSALLNFWSYTSSYSSSYELQFKSFFINRNQFGGLLFMSIVAHSYLCSDKKIRKINILIFIIQLLSVILTMSRGAILACAVFFSVLYLQHSKNLKVSLSVIAFCSIIIIGITSNSAYMGFITKYLIRPDVGSAGRTEIWKMGFGLAEQNNIVNGVGYFTGLDLAYEQGFKFDQFHNLYIDALVSGGIIELSLIVFLLIYVFRRCIKKCVDSGYKKIYVGSAVAMWVLGIFESVSFFSIGYTDTVFSIFFISLPLLLSNMGSKDEFL